MRFIGDFLDYVKRWLVAWEERQKANLEDGCPFPGSIWVWNRVGDAMFLWRYVLGYREDTKGWLYMVR